MTDLHVFAWVVLPYVTIAVLGVGLFWRYKYDKFGWTTRSSQMYESRLLRLGSPLFHVGILLAFAGHIVGLLVPERWTSAFGVTETTYHVVAVAMGSVAAVMVVSGMAILIYRRRTVGRVFRVTTPMDKAMYVVLAAVVLLGTYNTIGVNLLDLPGKYPDGFNYRETVSVWFRSIFWLHPQAELMAKSPLSFQLHAVAAMALFMLWPFTRLVHVLSAPVGYLSRPYVVYRSRGAHETGSRDPNRGWEPAARR
ncbi:MAG: respiratory nitrate reductase subunit gamma [Actinomycetes bacterium]